DSRVFLLFNSARHSKNTLERTHSMKDKAGQKCKPIDVFDFPDNSDVSSIGRLGENEKDEETYETFDPPLHSTAIYADEEEFSKHCGLSISSTPPGKEAKRSSDTSGNEASEIESVKISAKKPGRMLRPISDDSESIEESDTRIKVKSAEKINTQRHEVIRTTASSELSEKPAESVTSKKTGPLSAQPSVEKENLAIESQSKTQKKGKMSHDKRKKSRSKAVGSDTSDIVHIWCPEGMKTSDIKELNIVLPEFEKTHLEHQQRIESKVCKAAIATFYVNVKEQFIKMLQINFNTNDYIEKKRQRMIEVQDELLRLEPQLKQLQTKYDELKERKSSLRNAAYFLSNLKQLYQDYSDVQAQEPNVKETYDSSSLPALLFKARTLLGAESHLRNINHQLEKLLDQG
uniref:Centromere protein U n=1 Tax=Pan troglodytes TaxID=9598 RepID=A0A2I3S0M1_PANTR